MITIDEKDLDILKKYYECTPDQDTMDRLVDELADVLEKSSGQETGIYQDIDDTRYYRLYSGCSAVEVFVENEKIQIDFDMGWQLGNSLLNNNTNLLRM